MLSRRLLRTKVIKSLYAHFKSESDSLTVSEKNLMFSINKTHELYHQLLWLIVEVSNVAEARIETGRRKHLPSPEELNPNTKFINNWVVKIIRECTELTDYLTLHKLGWAQYPETIRSLYQAMTGSDYYKEYMADEERSFKSDLQLIVDFYSQTVDASEELEETIEEQSILWAGDLDYTNIMVVRTLGRITSPVSGLSLLSKFKDAEDEQFVRMLFRNTVVKHEELFQCIDRFTQNWDVERVAYMDKLIMATALTELIEFSEIPVKVTLDEYIEIAKYYSTPGSATFVNGVLDKAIEALREENRIAKIGRGLL